MMDLKDRIDWNHLNNYYLTDLFLKAAKYENIAIFGAGIGGAKTKDILEKECSNTKIAAFADNDKCKIGKKYRDIMVVDPNKLLDIPNCLIIVSSTAFNSIRNQLMGIGINNNDIYFFQPARLNLDDNSDVIFIQNNFEYYERAYKLLTDDKSRTIFSCILNYRVTRDESWLLEMESFIDNETDQYFDMELLESYKIEKGFVDGGAYNGDTCYSFFSHFENWTGQYYAFEADKRIFCELGKAIGKRDNISIFNYALWNTRESVGFDDDNGNGEGNHISYTSTNIIEADTIDHILGNKTIDFIKMDIEGAERMALLGAKETIRKNRPILAICIYHNIDDLFSIPLLIYELMGEVYSFYIRQYRYGISETVLYALPEPIKKDNF